MQSNQPNQEIVKIKCPSCKQAVTAIAYFGEIRGRCLVTGKDVVMKKIAGVYCEVVK